MITDNPFDLSGETPAAADTLLVASTLLPLRVRTAASLSVRLIPMLDSAKTSVRDELKRGFISLLYSGMISSLFLWSSVQLALALIEDPSLR